MLTKSPDSYQNSCAIETGLSNFHKMTVTALKTFFQKKGSKVISHRDYKNYSNDIFRQLVNDDFNVLYQTSNKHQPLQTYLNVCIRALDVCTPRKTKFVRANNSPFMNKNISKAIMNRSRLRNNFLRNRTPENRIAYNQQRNFCVSLIRETKREYFNSLNEKLVTDNKLFWNTIKPFFSDKGSTREKYTLIEEEEILDDGQKISTVFNDFFSSIVSNLNVPQYEDQNVNLDNIDDPLEIRKEKYKNYPSIVAILDKKFDKSFPFNPFLRKKLKKKF